MGHHGFTVHPSFLEWRSLEGHGAQVLSYMKSFLLNLPSLASCVPPTHPPHFLVIPFPISSCHVVSVFLLCILALLVLTPFFCVHNFFRVDNLGFSLAFRLPCMEAHRGLFSQMKMQSSLLHLHVTTLFSGQHENGNTIIQFSFSFIHASPKSGVCSFTLNLI